MGYRNVWNRTKISPATSPETTRRNGSRSRSFVSRSAVSRSPGSISPEQHLSPGSTRRDRFRKRLGRSWASRSPIGDTHDEWLPDRNR